MDDLDFARILLAWILTGRYRHTLIHELERLKQTFYCLEAPVIDWKIKEVDDWIKLLDSEGITETQERARNALKALGEWELCNQTIPR